MAKREKFIKNFDELPAVLTVQDFQEVMGLSKVTSYEYVNRRDFPKMKIGKRILIPKEAFIRWLEESTTIEI